MVYDINTWTNVNLLNLFKTFGWIFLTFLLAVWWLLLSNLNFQCFFFASLLVLPTHTASRDSTRTWAKSRTPQSARTERPHVFLVYIEKQKLTFFNAFRGECRKSIRMAAVFSGLSIWRALFSLKCKPISLVGEYVKN